MSLRENAFVDDTLADFGIEPIRREVGIYSDPVEFIQTQFFIPERQYEANPAMQLEPYQRAVLREAYRRDPETNKFIYDIVVWSDIKKSAKSSIAAAVMLHRALETPWGSFKVVANDLNQASSRVFYYLQRALSLNPEIGNRTKINNYKISIDNNAFIHALPIDPAGEAGGNDDLIEWTELHASQSKAAQAMWSEMTISPTKYGYSQRWIDTYAGHDNASPILYNLYDLGVNHGTRLALHDAPDDLEVYANGSLLVLWNTRPRMPWQSEDYYASEAQVLTPNEFNRMHRNQWASSTNAFIQSSLWDACAGVLPAMTPNEPMVIGMDAAVSHDCFALVGVSRRGETCYVRYVRVWTPPIGGHIDFGEVEAELRRLAAEKAVVCFTYDPYQMEDMAQRLTREGVGWFDSFNQSGDRLEADTELYQRILTRRLQHDGNDLLRSHVLNADAKIDPEGHKLRIIHRAPDKPMDATVALAMASKRASYLNIG